MFNSRLHEAVDKVGAKHVPSFKSIDDTSKFLRRARCQLLAISNSAEDHVFGDNDPIPCEKIGRVAEEATQSDVTYAAAKHGLSERSVKRLVEAHAHTVFLTEVLVLELAIEELKRSPPRWSKVTPQWDETLGRHKFQFGDAFGERVLTQSVHRFVKKLVISWGWANGERPPHFVECSIPPLPILATTWSHLREAMRNHYFTRPYWRIMLAIFELTTELRLRKGCTDKAS